MAMASTTPEANATSGQDYLYRERCEGHVELPASAPNYSPTERKSKSRATAQHVRALRCRWGLRIATARAQFAHFPGECLKPETAWRRGRDSNPRYRLPSTPD